VSLWDEVSRSLTGSGGVAGAIDGAIGSAAGAVFGNSGLGHAIGNVATGLATGAVNQALSGRGKAIANAAGRAAGELLRGNVGAAILNGLEVIPGLIGNAAAQALYWGTPTPLFGGISPAEARVIFDEMHAVDFSKKNLYLIEVDSVLAGDVSHRFNMFAIGLDYAPLTVGGEKRKIGSASIDLVQSSEPIELRITTYDDKSGFIKTWFSTHANAAAAPDGTVGLPSEYAIRIRIVHSVVMPEQPGFYEIGLFRVANIEHSLSRREGALEEISLTLTQLDTFFPV
jgi:hypothetical protein